MLTFIKNAPPRVSTDPNGRKRVRKRGIFKCGCGNISEYDFSSVKTGHTTRCIVCSRKSASTNKTKHGKINHPLYRKWSDMKKRCYNKNVDRYHVYGGRGIVVYDVWKNDFTSFYDWCIKNGWEKGKSIDRINVNGNYTPKNCRIVDLQQQKYNLQNTIYVRYCHGIYSLAEIVNLLKDPNLKYVVYSGIKKCGKDFNYYVQKKGLLKKIESLIKSGKLKDRSDEATSNIIG